MEKYKMHMMVAILVLLFINLLTTCSNNSKTKSLAKKVSMLDSALVKLEARPVPLTDAQVRDAVKDECMESMYKYLIYETDLDKGKTSLSQIRSDIDRVKTAQ